jgi:signal transduction histidine kinase
VAGDLACIQAAAASVRQRAPGKPPALASLGHPLPTIFSVTSALLSPAALAWFAFLLAALVAAGALGHWIARLQGLPARQDEDSGAPAAPVPGLYWRTDAQGCLQQMRALAQPSPFDAKRGEALLNWLQDAGPVPGQLATLLQSQAVLSGHAVRWTNGVAAAQRAAQANAAVRDAVEPDQPDELAASAQPVAGRLWARPVHDRQGRFIGHVGAVLPEQRHGSQALADALIAADAPPLLLLRRTGADTPWQPQGSGAAGRAWLRESPADIAWRQRLPSELQAALQQPHLTAPAQAEGWTLRPVAGPGLPAGPEQALLFAPPAEAHDSDDPLSFSYTLSHDLRAPLRVVEGFTRIVKEDYGAVLDRVGNDHLDRVLGAAARMNQMIDALLAMARLSTQPLVRQPVSLSRLAQFVVDDLRRSAPERSIDITVEDGLAATGDPTLLRQVLENLIGNAWKYTQRTAAPSVFVGVEAIDGRRTFVVRDNGAGFDMRGVDRLFGLFQRLHSASDFPGTGVGLASVRRIVARHGGRIWAEGEPGRGASFYFTLRD